MTYYEWVCHDCEVLWEEDHPIGTAPKKTPCPECEELRERNWAGVTTFQMKGDCHTNRVRMRKYHTEGMDKDTAEEYYDAAIKRTEKGLRTGWQHYSKITPNIEVQHAAGAITKRTDQEAKNAMERAKQMTKAVYNDNDIDISETLTRKPQ